MKTRAEQVKTLTVDLNHNGDNIDKMVRALYGLESYIDSHGDDGGTKLLHDVDPKLARELSNLVAGFIGSYLAWRDAK
jgi:hypothetical protein